MGFHMIDDDPWTKCQAKPSQHFLYKVAKKGEEKRNVCIVATVLKFVMNTKLHVVFIISFLHCLYYFNSVLLPILL